MQIENKLTFTPSQKDFVLMVLGQIISILGSSLLRFALSLYVLDSTGSETLFATLYAISSIPLILSPIGGALADRFNRRNLMVIFDFASSAIVLCLIIMMEMFNASILSIGVIMVLISVVSSLYTPAVTASIPLLVSEDKLENANGIVQAVQALSAVTAPILGGVLYGVLGAQIIVIFSCISFFMSAVMEIFIKIPFIEREQTEHIIPTIVKDMKFGFLYVIRQRFILKSGIIAILLNMILSPYFIVGAPIVLRVTMDSSDVMYGIGMALINFATIIGALTIGYFSKKMSMRKLYRWIAIVALLILPITLSLMPFMLKLGYFPSFIIFMLGLIPIAVILTSVSIYIITKVQKATPNENLGKVMSILMSVAQCAAPIGQIVYGIIFETFSAKIFIPTFLVSLLTMLIAFLTLFLMRDESENC